MLILKIDNRENKCISLIEEQKSILRPYELKSVVEPLPLGDFIIADEETGEELIIIERKSLSDLASSIRDGRYYEQSTRLDSLPLSNHNIIYLIEGDMAEYNRRSAKFNKMSGDTLYASMVSVLAFKGFSVFRSFNINETVVYILQMMKKLDREFKNGKELYYKMDTEMMAQKGGSGGDGSGVISTHKPYVHNISKVKKDNLRPDNIGEIILSQIPGISAVTSLAIMEKAGSLYNLMISLREDDGYLDDVKTITKKGQKRSITKKARDAVREYLLYAREDETIKISMD